MPSSPGHFISGRVSPGYESVRDVFEKYFALNEERNASVCVYVGEEVVVDLVGGRDRDYVVREMAIEHAIDAKERPIFTTVWLQPPVHLQHVQVRLSHLHRHPRRQGTSRLRRQSGQALARVREGEEKWHKKHFPYRTKKNFPPYLSSASRL